MVTTVNVTGYVTLPDGSEPTGAVLEFKLTSPDHDTASNTSIPTSSVYRTLGTSGSLTVPLWPNDLGSTNSKYQVTASWVGSDGKNKRSVLGHIQPLSSGGNSIADLLVTGSAGISEAIVTLVDQSEYEATLAAAVTQVVADTQASADSAVSQINTTTDTAITQVANDTATYIAQAAGYAGSAENSANSAYDSMVQASNSEDAASVYAANALSSQNAAASYVGAGVWVSGQSYNTNTVVTSPLTFQQYRANQNTSGTTDPSADAANWARVNVAVVPALSASITDSSAVVAKCIFSLSDMSDGGASIRNAKHTSWYKALGPMPEKCEAFGFAGSVVIRDLTKAGAPVWATFNGAANSVSANNALWLPSGSSVSSVCFTADGRLVIGVSGSGGGAVELDFLKNRRILHYQAAQYLYKGDLSQANDLLSHVQISSVGIASADVKSVASFTYPDAPCDPATGLPIAEISVGHAAGVSVIKPNGTVVNLTDTSGEHVSYTADGMLAVVKPNHVDIGPSPTSSMSFGSWVKTRVSDPAWAADIRSLEVTGSKIAAGKYLGGPEGVTAIHRDALASTMMTTTWVDTQFSGLVGSWLNSADDADLVGGELVTNGDFSGGLTGWDAGAGVTASGGAAACSGAATILTQSMGLVSGKSYVLTLTYTETSSLRLRVEGSPSGGVLATSGSISGTGSGTLTFNFVAASSGVKIAADGATFTGTIDNVSVRLADPDRSVSGKGLAVYGTVAKSEAVAGSGGLMAYSGFSASNYLEQPYNSAMDVGTGDFAVTAMVYGADSLSTATIMSRAASNITGWHLYKETTSSTGALKFRMAGAVLSGTSKIGAGWYHVAARRIGSTVDLIVNGRVEATYTVSTTMSSTAPLQVGWSTVTPLVAGLPAIAQAQVYARGLSDDEISALYRLQRAALYGKTTLRSGDIKAIASDPYSGDLHVLTAVGRQVFDSKTLQEIEFEAVTGKTKLAVHNGTVSLS